MRICRTQGSLVGLGLSWSVGGWVHAYTDDRISMVGSLVHTDIHTHSIGCIMGELLIEKPLFRADTDLAQLEAIFKVRSDGGGICVCLWICGSVDSSVEACVAVGSIRLACFRALQLP